MRAPTTHAVTKKIRVRPVHPYHAREDESACSTQYMRVLGGHWPWHASTVLHAHTSIMPTTCHASTTGSTKPQISPNDAREQLAHCLLEACEPTSSGSLVECWPTVLRLCPLL